MRQFLTMLLFAMPAIGFSQVDSAFLLRIKAVETTDFLKTDTLAAPDDSFTRKIRELRKEKNGIDIEVVVQIKIKEEQEKDKSRPKEFYDQLLKELTTGRTGRLLENSLVNMYREAFTEQEVDELIRFYKTPAGKKMNSEFILLIARSVKDAEQLMKMAAAELEKKKAF